MYNQTAYEAYYTYLAFEIQSKMLDYLTSPFFLSIISFLFILNFLHKTTGYFRRFLPDAFQSGRGANIEDMVKTMIFFVFALSILNQRVSPKIISFSGNNWKDSQYLKTKGIEHSNIKVSAVYYYFLKGFSEISAAFSYIIDDTFKTNEVSQLKAPDFVYKAMLSASSATFKLPETKRAVDIFTIECMDKLLSIPKNQKKENLDYIFGGKKGFNQKLSKINSKTYGGDCESLRKKVNILMTKEAGLIRPNVKVESLSKKIDFDYYSLAASSRLTNHYLSKLEDSAGISHSAKFDFGQEGIINSATYQYFDQMFDSKENFAYSVVRNLGYDGSKVPVRGMNNALEAAKKLNNMTKRAPHILGALNIFLAVSFVAIIFLIPLGIFKFPLFWVGISFSTHLWLPANTLLFYIMKAFYGTADQLKDFSELGGGMFLYSSNLMVTKMWDAFETYANFQTFIGPAITAIFAGFMSFKIFGSLHSTPNTNTGEHAKNILQDASEKAVTASVTAANPALGAKMSGAMNGLKTIRRR